MNKNIEQGRTMTEMLGTLAIMGILSVSGIVGYKIAMDKYKADELLNEANKRAAVIAAKVLQGTPNLSLNEFTQPVGYRFTVKNWNHRQFALTLRQADNQLIDERICRYMKSMVGQNSAIRQIGKNCLNIIFNRDLSAENVPSDQACLEENECDGCQTCRNGYCEDKCVAGQLCVQGESASDYVCRNVPSGCEACSEDQLCQMKVSGDFSNSCAAPDEVQCISMYTGIALPAATRITTAMGKSLPVYFFSKQGTFWTQKALCEFHGKRMITLADLGLQKPESTGCWDCLNTSNEGVADSFWENLGTALGGGDMIIRVSDSYDACSSYTLLFGQKVLINSEYRHIQGYKKGRPYYSVLCVD